MWVASPESGSIRRRWASPVGLFVTVRKNLPVLEGKLLGVVKVEGEDSQAPTKGQVVRATRGHVEITVLFKTGVPGAIT